jgi:hypothetical protein
VAPSPTITIPNTDSALGGDAVFDKPTLRAETGTGSVSFHWTYPQPAKGDSYYLQWSFKKSDVRNGKVEVLKTTLHTVKAPAGQEVCATVLVSRAGQSSPPAEVACETAR